MEQSYYEVKNIYLAQALAFFNFQYYKFNDENGKIRYIFQDTKEFRNMLYTLTEMKKQLTK